MKYFSLFAALLMLMTGCGNSNNAKKGQENSAANKEEMQIDSLSALKARADSVGYIVKVGEIAPDFTCTLTDNSTVTLSSLKGKVVMLQFTASWCGVCRKEMPFIEKDIWQKHKENPEFVLIGIDRDEPLETVLKFGKDVKVTYPLALDPGAEIFAKYALKESGITRNVLIDRDGKIIMLTRLFNEEEFNKLVKTIDNLLTK